MNILSIIKRWAEIPVHHRTLFWGFVRNEIKGRFAGSIGGFFWSLVTPLANLIIYIFVFSVVLKVRLKPMETGTASFAVYFLTGLLPWTAFSEALNNATEILLSRANLITKVAFPLEILPISGVIVPFCLNGLGFGMFLIYLLSKGYFQYTWFWLPLVIIIHMVFTLGMVSIIASLSVFIRDIKHFIVTALSLWFFLTPIIYPISMIPEKFRWAMKMNPMFPFIQLYHQTLLHHNISLGMLAYAIILALLCLACSLLFFERSKYAFADVL